jgi:hypothetical protein
MQGRDLQELQRKAVQPSVLGLVDHTHTPAAELFYDAVMRDGLADHRATPCYAAMRSKSMKANALMAWQKASWRKGSLAFPGNEPFATPGHSRCSVSTCFLSSGGILVAQCGQVVISSSRIFSGLSLRRLGIPLRCLSFSVLAANRPERLRVFSQMKGQAGRTECLLADTALFSVWDSHI